MLDLLNKNNLNSEQKKLCNIIHDSSTHLNRLVNDIYDLASIDTNTFTTKEHEFNLQNLLENLEKIYLRKSVNINVSFTFDKNNNVPDLLLGDSNRLMQVLVNLLDNALKHTSEGSIKLIIQKVYKRSLSIGLNFIITDTGSGFIINNNQFIQNQNTEVKDLGIGLSIVNSIVEKLNGTINFKSEINKGTKIEIYLPFKLKSKKLDLKKDKPFKIKKLKKKINILIIDGNEINTLILMKLLINHGNFYLDIASSSDEVLEMVTTNSYDIIILDMHMKEMETLKLLQTINNHENKNISNINIIPMYTSLREDIKSSILKQNITSNLEKPFTREKLYSEIYKNI